MSQSLSGPFPPAPPTQQPTPGAGSSFAPAPPQRQTRGAGSSFPPAPQQMGASHQNSTITTSTELPPTPPQSAPKRGAESLQVSITIEKFLELLQNNQQFKVSCESVINIEQTEALIEEIVGKETFERLDEKIQLQNFHVLAKRKLQDSRPVMNGSSSLSASAEQPPQITEHQKLEATKDLFVSIGLITKDETGDGIKLAEQIQDAFNVALASQVGKEKADAMALEGAAEQDQHTHPESAVST